MLSQNNDNQLIHSRCLMKEASASRRGSRSVRQSVRQLSGWFLELKRLKEVYRELEENSLVKNPRRDSKSMQRTETGPGGCRPKRGPGIFYLHFCRFLAIF